MKAVFLLALVFFVAVATATVHELNENNFDSFVQSQDFTLVKFFAPWCGHCKALKVPYEEAAVALEGKAKIAEVDCTKDESKALCEKNGVRGYPTLKFIGKDGSVQEYDEGRTKDAIVGYVLAATQPAVTYITSADELKEFKAGANELKLVINTKKGSAVADVVEGVAKSLRKTAAIAIDTTVTDDKVTLYRTFDEPEVAFEGEVTGAALTKFVNDNSLPIIGEIGPHNYKKYVDRNLPLTWIFLDVNDKKQVAAIEEIKAVAKKFNDKAMFATLDGNKWASHAKSFGLEKSTPGIVIEDRTSRKKFAYPADEITVADFQKFLEGFVAKTLKPIFRSEPVPASNDGPITTVVGTTYKDIVYNNDKDVFVVYKASWCGHCKALAPKYAEVAEHYKNDKNIVIAEMDAANNDVDETQFEITGFPTLYFFKSGAKEQAIRYNGQREKDDLIAFIDANRATKPSTENKDEL
eukprot:UN02074